MSSSAISASTSIAAASPTIPTSPCRSTGLEEMAAAGEIGGVAPWHYTFMGGHPQPQMFDEAGTEVGRLLAADGVDVALLVPI